MAGESIVVYGDLTYSENLPVFAKNADYLIIDSGGAIVQGSKAKNKTDKAGKNRNKDNRNSPKTALKKANQLKKKHMLT